MISAQSEPSRASKPWLIPGALLDDRAWGWFFGGNQISFCNALRESVAAHIERKDGEPFRYVEIGIGPGQTLYAVAAALSTMPDCPDWHCYGVDLLGLATGGESLARYHPFTDQISIHLCGSRDYFRANVLRYDYAFIDGCHGRACAMADFLDVEPVMKPGGIICFHDAEEACQGLYYQEHCKEPIGVRRGLSELGLLNGSRPGWELWDQTKCNVPKQTHGSIWVRRLE